MAELALRSFVNVSFMRCKPAFSTGALRRGFVFFFMEEFSVARSFPALDKKQHTSLMSREPKDRGCSQPEGLLSDHRRSCKLILHQKWGRTTFHLIYHLLSGENGWKKCCDPKL